ncbi:MAG: hypothetical protein OXG65_11015 [Chloroflexi bacterium]|nr:hypothetical protein [Chloroflexota bacterium]
MLKRVILVLSSAILILISCTASENSIDVDRTHIYDKSFVEIAWQNAVGIDRTLETIREESVQLADYLAAPHASEVRPPFDLSRLETAARRCIMHLNELATLERMSVADDPIDAPYPVLGYGLHRTSRYDMVRGILSQACVNIDSALGLMTAGNTTENLRVQEQTFVEVLRRMNIATHSFQLAIIEMPPVEKPEWIK